MATDPLIVSAEEADQATSTTADAMQVLKGSATQGVAGPVVVDAMAGFDTEGAQIGGVEKLIKSIALGVSRGTGTSTSTPNTVVKRDAEGDFAAREISIEKLIFKDATYLTSAPYTKAESDARYSLLGHTHAASVITVTPSGNLISTNVQAALTELQGDIDALQAGGGGGISQADADTRYVNVTGDTMTGALTIDGALTVDTNTLYVNPTTNRVGIGTTNPSFELHVVGAANITTTLTTGQTVNFAGGTLYANYGTKRVGINNVSPSYPLDITDSTSTVGMVRFANTASSGVAAMFCGGSVAQIYVGAFNSHVSYNNYQHWGRIHTNASANGLNFTTEGANKPITFATGTTGANQQPERVRIQGDGKVGIGNSSPAEVLDVTGNVQATRLISTVATGTAPFTVSSTTVVTNLNADLLDGQHASDFALTGHSHAASAITVTPTGNLASTNVQAALEELQGEIGSGTATSTYDATCPSSIAVGDFVVATGTTSVDLASQSNLATKNVVGIVVAKPDATTARVQMSGPTPGGVLSGLTPGATYFVGNDGRASATLPTGSAGTELWCQVVGIATNATTLVVRPETCIGFHAA